MRVARILRRDSGTFWSEIGVAFNRCGFRRRPVMLLSTRTSTERKKDWH
jgi:hypothetical protein